MIIRELPQLATDFGVVFHANIIICVLYRGIIFYRRIFAIEDIRVIDQLYSNRPPGNIRSHVAIRSAPLTGLCLTALLAACGGGGGGGSSFVSAPPGGGSGWQSGVFLDADTFFARCEAPRSGPNPATNQPFPDIQGSVLEENNFLRSFSDDVYLWFDEIADQDPGLFNDALVYFAELQTNETTASGQFKDKFHFTFDSEDWFQLSQSGVSAGYGVQWVILSGSVPREIVVAFSEAGTAAAQAGLARGATVLTVDGVDFINGTDFDTINGGIFPASADESHTFEVQDLGAQTTRMITMVSANITSDPVQNVHKISTATGAVGYMLFNDHIATAEQELISAVNTLNADGGITDLVLDLRYNGGGFLDIASEMAFMIAGTVPTAGQPFETIQFNAKHPITNPITGQPLTPIPFHTVTQGFLTVAGQPLPSLDLDRVFVITGPGTCSASESIMNSLRGVNVEVIQIGSTTCGKPFGFFPIDNCGTTYFTIQFRGVNAMNFGDYTDGFSPANTLADIGSIVPGCSVADDFTTVLGDPSEGRLSAALNFRENSVCDAPSGKAGPGISKTAHRLSAVDGIVVKSPWHSNRILRQ